MKCRTGIRRSFESILMAIFVLGVASCSDSPTTVESTDPVVDDDGGFASGVNTIEKIDGQFIVVLDDDTDPGAVDAIVADLLDLTGGVLVGEPFTDALKGFTVRGEGLLGLNTTALELDPRVRYIEEDYMITFLPIFMDEDPNPSSQQTPYGVTRVGGSADASGKSAWVIDTGIDEDHPDLNVDATRSRSFVLGEFPSDYDDGNGHGTHIAGTIGAIDNGRDVVGVAAGANLVAVRVLDDNGRGSYSGIIAGLDYVAANGAGGDVANLSFGGPASRALDDAVIGVAESNIFVSIAAGNESANAGTVSPARVNHPRVYTISAMDENDRFASFSNFGNPPVDYAQPGVRILSTRAGGGTTVMNGTSMAAPHMAGVLLSGSVSTDGTVSNDPDNNPDPIAVR